VFTSLRLEQGNLETIFAAGSVLLAAVLPLRAPCWCWVLGLNDKRQRVARSSSHSSMKQRSV